MSSIGTATSTSKAELTNLPLKLHALLDEAERLGQSSIVSWESDGTAFKVHDKKRFVEEIMPKYFSTSNYQSFQRYVKKINTAVHFGVKQSISLLTVSRRPHPCIFKLGIAIYGAFERHPKDPTKANVLTPALSGETWTLVEP
jgi:HSF-type DNA-binding